MDGKMKCFAADVADEGGDTTNKSETASSSVFSDFGTATAWSQIDDATTSLYYETATFDVVNTPFVNSSEVDLMAGLESCPDSLSLPKELGDVLHYTLVSKPRRVAVMLDILTRTKTTDPSIFINFEGVELGEWNGSVCLLQIEHTVTDHRFLVDVHLLRSLAFTTSGSNGVTLKNVLESKDIIKGIWDGRNDSAGVFRGFGIKMAGLRDLQLLSLQVIGSRFRPKLADAILNFCKMSQKSRTIWLNTKNAGQRLFALERGGTYEVFEQRPISKLVAAYSLADSMLLPELHKALVSKLSKETIKDMDEFSQKSTQQTFQDSYQAVGRDKARNPFLDHRVENDYPYYPLRVQVVLGRLQSNRVFKRSSNISRNLQRHELRATSQRCSSRTTLSAEDADLAAFFLFFSYPVILV